MWLSRPSLFSLTSRGTVPRGGRPAPPAGPSERKRGQQVPWEAAHTWTPSTGRCTDFPGLPATSPVMRLLKPLVRSLCSSQCHFPATQHICSGQFRHQSMFVRKILPGGASGGVCGAWPLHENMGRRPSRARAFPFLPPLQSHPMPLSTWVSGLLSA